jgi:hypothetical protein
MTSTVLFVGTVIITALCTGVGQLFRRQAKSEITDDDEDLYPALPRLKKNP